MQRISLALLVAMALGASPALGLMIPVSLDSAQEIPTPTVDGFTPIGSATVDVDTTTGAITIEGSYSGMTSNVVGAHLHGLTDPSPTAGIIIGLDISGGTSGTFSGSGTLTAEELAGLLGGRTYLNVHTSNNLMGEIRGNFVPEPGTAMLLLLGCAGLAGLRQRRSR